MVHYDKVTEIISKLNTNVVSIFQEFEEACMDSMHWINGLKEETKKRMGEYENYKDAPLLVKPPLSKTKTGKRPALTSSSEDEVENRVEETSANTEFEGYLKPKRTASTLALHKINEQANLRLNMKMRRPRNTDKENLPSYISTGVCHIKVEKDIIEENENDSPKAALSDATNEIMPPPISKPPKRVRKKVKKEVESDSEAEYSHSKTAIVKLEKLDKSVAMNKEVPKVRVTRSTRTKQRHNDSDVLIQEPAVSLVVISDSESDEQSPASNGLKAGPPANEETACTNEDDVSDGKENARKVKAQKRTKKTAKNRAKANNEQAKPSEVNEVEKTNESVYEDAVSQKAPEAPKPALESTATILEQLRTPENSNKRPESKELYNNCTVVLEKMNETVVLRKASEQEFIVNKTMVLSTQSDAPGWQEPEAPLPVADDNILTDDESDEEKTPKNAKKTGKKVEEKRDGKKATKTKPMFSPYESSPVKKRVAAFEKLGSAENPSATAPTRVTRTKTRLAEKEKEREVKAAAETARSVAKPKYVTPLLNNKLPSMIPQSDGKLYRNHLLASNSKLNNNTLSSEASVKCATSVKPSRTELQEKREEEQRRRLEKELDAKRKKEAMMQAKIEEQKRKREEKQLKAQIARENKEREKDEKFRQILQVKQDKMQEKQQEEMQRKLKKAAEAEEKRKLDEQLRLAVKLQEAKKKLETEKKPYKPTPLPTEDCDDSDDSSEVVARHPGPLWGQSKELEPKLRAQRYIPPYFIETLFQMRATTPDLRAMFTGIADYKLQRNSSAIWRTPPRYSQLAKF